MPLHTKKTNNTNKLMQISYYFTLTKIQKLQNLKLKKKNFFLYWWVCSVSAGIARNWLIFFPVWNMDVICTDLLVGMVYTNQYGTYTVRNRLPKLYLKVRRKQVSGSSAKAFRGKYNNGGFVWKDPDAIFNCFIRDFGG